MARQSVSIGKRFLSEVRSQYQSWVDALVREAFQNCVDAPGARRVDFEVKLLDNGNTEFVFSNNGKPMDESVLVGKLLTLGESGKEHEGTVGGFGRAKELLYFCHESYEIHSGSFVVRGEGCEYDLEEVAQPLAGTRSQVVVAGDYVHSLLSAVERCVGYSQFSGLVCLNGEVVHQRTARGRKRDWDGEDWGRVYTSTQHKNRLVVRVNGVFMFSRHVTYNGCVVLELNTSQGVMTSNRDGLRYTHASVLDEFVQNLAINRRAAFKQKAPKYTRYAGRRLRAEFADQTFRLDLNGQAERLPKAWSSAKPEDSSPHGGLGVRYSGETQVQVADKGLAAAIVSALHACENPVANPESASLAYAGNIAVKHDFVLRNELCETKDVPVYYDPGSHRFSANAKWLASVWAKLLVELHALFEKRTAFSIGFIFDEDADGQPSEAAYEEQPSGDVYYVAPCRLVSRKGKSQFVPRWSKSDRWALLAVAAHEFVHGEGYGYHDERYAARLTDVLGVVLKNRGRFVDCFKS